MKKKMVNNKLATKEEWEIETGDLVNLHLQHKYTQKMLLAMELHNILLNKVVNFKCNLETLELCKKNQKFVWAELCFESTHFPHVIKNQYLYCLGAAFYAFLGKKV